MRGIKLLVLGTALSIVASASPASAQIRLQAGECAATRDGGAARSNATACASPGVLPGPTVRSSAAEREREQKQEARRQIERQAQEAEDKAREAYERAIQRQQDLQRRQMKDRSARSARLERPSDRGTQAPGSL